MIYNFFVLLVVAVVYVKNLPNVVNFDPKVDDEEVLEGEQKGRRRNENACFHNET